MRPRLLPGRTPSFGERGSIDPALLRHGERVWLLYRTSAPETWTVAEMDAAGRRLRRAVHPEESLERPVVFSGAEGPRLLWPGSVGGGRSERETEPPWEATP